MSCSFRTCETGWIPLFDSTYAGRLVGKGGGCHSQSVNVLGVSGITASLVPCIPGGRRGALAFPYFSHGQASELIDVQNVRQLGQRLASQGRRSPSILSRIPSVETGRWPHTAEKANECRGHGGAPLVHMLKPWSGEGSM